MATVSETATITPIMEMFQTPMRPDNTPIDRSLPIGVAKWYGGFTSAAVLSTNIVEIAISFTIPANLAFRFTNLFIEGSATDAAASTTLDWFTDRSEWTLPFSGGVQHIVANKPDTASEFTITNARSSINYIPKSGSDFSRLTEVTSPLIWRVISKASGTARVAIQWQSFASAYIYTVEQLSQGFSHKNTPIIASPGTSTAD